MLDAQIREFIVEKCPYKANWCNGQHIPSVKMTNRKGSGDYAIFTDNDSSKIKDKGPCVYYENGRCMHPSNPRVRRDFP